MLEQPFVPRPRGQNTIGRRPVTTRVTVQIIELVNSKATKSRRFTIYGPSFGMVEAEVKRVLEEIA